MEIDIVQITIASVSFVLTLIIVFLSVQVWHILHELRDTVEKVNKMLDDMGNMTGQASEAVSGINGLLSGVKSGLAIVNKFKKNDKKEEE